MPWHPLLSAPPDALSLGEVCAHLVLAVRIVQALKLGEGGLGDRPRTERDGWVHGQWPELRKLRVPHFLLRLSVDCPKAVQVPAALLGEQEEEVAIFLERPAVQRRCERLLGAEE